MSQWDFDRHTLLASLKQIAPAIAKSQAAAVASVFENIWFTGYGAMASNDMIAMVVTLHDDGPVAGVHGDRLIKLLTHCHSPAVSFAQNGDGRLQVRADFAAKLLTHASEPPFVWPQPNEDIRPIEVDERLLAFAKLAKVVIDPHATSQQACGVTVIQDDGGLYLYATNRASLVRCVSEQPGDPKEVILSLAFVEQMLRLGTRTPGLLILEADYALFECGEVGLWGRYLVPEPDASDLEKVLRKHRPPLLMPLPPEFWPAVARTGVMAEQTAVALPVDLLVKDNVMTLRGKGAGGEVTGDLPFEHAPIALRFNQRLVERLGRLGIGRLGMTKKGLLFGSDDGAIEYLVAAH